MAQKNFPDKVVVAESLLLQTQRYRIRGADLAIVPRDWN